MWDYSDPTITPGANTSNGNSSHIAGARLLTESYHDRPDDLPACIDIHPGGRLIAYACEADVRYGTNMYPHAHNEN